MKIVVDSMPKSVAECLFSERNREYGYVCRLRPLIDGKKPTCLCRNVDTCPCLIELKDAVEQGDISL